MLDPALRVHFFALTGLDKANDVGVLQFLENVKLSVDALLPVGTASHDFDSVAGTGPISSELDFAGDTLTEGAPELVLVV